MEEFGQRVMEQLEDTLVRSRKYNAKYLIELTKIPGGLEYVLELRLRERDENKR